MLEPAEYIDLVNKVELWWKHIPKGGYGYPVYVPVEYIKRTQRRYLMRALKKDGTFSQVAVDIKNIYKKKIGTPV